MSISIPTTNRFDPLAVRGSEASTERDHVEKEESHQESSAPLFKCPTVRYIWGTRSTTTETEVESAIAQLGVNRVSFRIERRESTNKGKHVWYFALLADQGTIEQITSLWTLPWKIRLHLNQALAPSPFYTTAQMPSHHLLYTITQMSSLHLFISAIITQTVFSFSLYNLTLTVKCLQFHSTTRSVSLTTHP